MLLARLMKKAGLLTSVSINGHQFLFIDYATILIGAIVILQQFLPRFWFLELQSITMLVMVHMSISSADQM